METEVRNRKSKSLNSVIKFKGKNEVNNSDLLESDTELKKPSTILEETDTDSNDGNSTSSTPPPEFNEDKTALIQPLQSQEKKKSSKRFSKLTMKHSETLPATDSSVSFTLQLDGVALVLFMVAFATRIWRLESPRAVVFDELHYGKYAGMYIQNTFFFDSQPPLGKQLIALAAYLAGFDGNYKFERIGQVYDAVVPISAMRFVPALFGSMLIPTVYKLLMEVGLSSWTGALAAFLMIFDNSILTQSRFMLMESMLLFFSAFGLLCILKFRKFYSRPFSLPWFFCLILGAVFLTAGFCVRFFGLFTFFLGIGILIKDFWSMVGDRAVSDLQLFLHLVVRTLTFISIPIMIYLATFYVHLSMLYKAGPNDNIMTSAFQASLEGGLAAIIANQPVKILHGSQVTLRHTHGRTCWLHSHDEVYPIKFADDRGSSHQQQVTCYSYKDVNNWWIVKLPNVEELVVSEPHQPIKHGDVIQLVHGLTSRALNSHDVASAMSPHAQEVSCYIDYNISMPAQTFWRVELLNKDSTDGFWHAVESELRLVHLNTTSVLKFSGRQLPDWGFRQHEIVADKFADSEDTVWNVEEHRYSRVEDQKEREKQLIEQEMIPTERKNLTFFEKLYELQYKMLFNNQENVAGHMYASEPLDWLLLKRGVAYWISSTSNAQVHFLGNVVVWLSGSISLITYLSFFLLYLLRRQRAFYDLPENEWNKFCTVGEVFMCGYLIHYLPYFLVERTLFLHHYLPAYAFKICILAFVIDHGHYLISKRLKWQFLSLIYILLVGLWMASVLYVFVRFAPLTYGDVDLTADQVSSLSWRETWDIIIHKQ